MAHICQLQRECSDSPTASQGSSLSSHRRCLCHRLSPAAGCGSPATSRRSGSFAAAAQRHHPVAQFTGVANSDIDFCGHGMNATAGCGSSGTQSTQGREGMKQTHRSRRRGPCHVADPACSVARGSTVAAGAATQAGPGAGLAYVGRVLGPPSTESDWWDRHCFSGAVVIRDDFASVRHVVSEGEPAPPEVPPAEGEAAAAEGKTAEDFIGAAALTPLGQEAATWRMYYYGRDSDSWSRGVKPPFSGMLTGRIGMATSSDGVRLEQVPGGRSLEAPFSTPRLTRRPSTQSRWQSRMSSAFHHPLLLRIRAGDGRSSTWVPVWSLGKSQTCRVRCCQAFACGQGRPLPLMACTLRGT